MVFNFTEQETVKIINILVTQPYNQVFDLINKIQSQFILQNKIENPDQITQSTKEV